MKKKAIEIFGAEYRNYDERKFRGSHFDVERPEKSTVRYFINRNCPTTVFALIEYSWYCRLYNRMKGVTIEDEYTLVQIENQQAYDELRDCGLYVYQPDYTAPMDDLVDEVELPSQIKSNLRKHHKLAKCRAFIWYDADYNPIRMEVIFLTPLYAKILYAIVGLPLELLSCGLPGIKEYYTYLRGLTCELSLGKFVSDNYFYHGRAGANEMIDEIIKYNDRK